ncbi:MAG: phosphoribosylformylglycinamidine cyclo-ligase [Treponema sp.]|jgi:phosphoribosylformylglycinamidine cyclo-ligase|nr:phosphoribosylformylglycinamidine cyclo-ligase [Treponema sp.]
MDYKQAGVNIEEGYRAVEKYRELAAGTVNQAVLNRIGGFAGIFSLKEIIAAGSSAGIDDPVLVSGTDGVGTKLDIAFRMKKYDTVGIDCVAMCVNDILCHGARPLFFLDYLACGKLNADVAAALVKGVAAGCRETGSVLLGGETAEMPGFYEPEKYDIAGFALGIADRKKIIEGKNIRAGDALIGIASSGAHSNGFSLIRRVIPDLNEDFGGMPIGMALLEPTRLYVKPVLGLMEEFEIRGMAHITGGGFYENIPRMFPPLPGERAPGFDAVIREPRHPQKPGLYWTIPPLFARIAYGLKDGSLPGSQAEGGITPGLRGAAAQQAGAELLETDGVLRKLMFNTFNMGIGFVLALAPENAAEAIAFLADRGYPAWEIGRAEAPAGQTGEVRFE